MEELYSYYVGLNPDTAQRIRNEYQINLSFIEIVLEILRKILSFILPSKKAQVL